MKYLEYLSLINSSSSLVKRDSYDTNYACLNYFRPKAQ